MKSPVSGSVFDGLTPGDYYVVFTLPGGGYVFSPQDAVGGTEATDSDANTATGKTAQYYVVKQGLARPSGATITRTGADAR